MNAKEEIKNEILNEQPKLRNYRIENFDGYLKIKSKYNLSVNPRIKRLEDYKGYKVFIVNALLIRNKIDIDFVMGGNGFIYLYIPIDEIWIGDIYEKTEEIKYILIHEYTEAELMKKGKNYEEAHDAASVKELIMRRNNASAEY